MGDKEIIKTLKCCTTKGAKCSDCPAFKKVDRSDCKRYFRGAIDLITRQKAEIDRLKNENDILSRNADTAFQDGLNEAQDLYAEQVKDEIKSEAIKEFAKRLKEEWFSNRYYSPDIDFDDFIDIMIKNMRKEDERK